jgi:hypothetical protein
LSGIKVGFGILKMFSNESDQGRGNKTMAKKMNYTTCLTKNELKRMLEHLEKYNDHVMVLNLGEEIAREKGERQISFDTYKVIRLNAQSQKTLATLSGKDTIPAYGAGDYYKRI